MGTTTIKSVISRILVFSVPALDLLAHFLLLYRPAAKRHPP